jgi:hypothetical protein
VPLSVYAKWNRDREKVIVLQRDMIRKAQRTIEQQRIEIARLKSEIARCQRNDSKPHGPAKVRPAR